MARQKKIKLPDVDGLGPKDKKKLRAAIRMVWSWNHARKLCIARATDKEGFGRCENPKCPQKGKRVPKIYADHIARVGSFDSGFIDRMFRPSKELQALCKRCHDKKTREEQKLERQLDLIDSYLELKVKKS